MNKINNAFAAGKALIAFITCGDPDPETTAACVRQAVANGAALVELGIPFSDPTAEGPVLQEAGLRALEAGVTTDRIFDMVRGLRRDVTAPLVFMTYANVVFSYGADRFISTCRDIGIDGLIIPDLPFEEKEEFLPLCHQYDVALISMIAPASHDRIARIAQEAEGFLYFVAQPGMSSEPVAGFEAMLQVVRRSTGVPCAIDLDISTPEQACTLAAYFDGVIVGSAIVRIVERYGAEAPGHVGEYVRTMTEAMS